MTQYELQTAINIVVELVRDYGGFAEYLLRYELAAQGIVLDNEEIMVTIEAALVRAEAAAEGGAVSRMELLTMPVKGHA